MRIRRDAGLGAAKAAETWTATGPKPRNAALGLGVGFMRGAVTPGLTRPPSLCSAYPSEGPVRLIDACRVFGKCAMIRP